MLNIAVLVLALVLPGLTGAETLSFTGQVHALDRGTLTSRSEELLELMDLRDAADKNGVVYGDYTDVLDGVGQVMGCDASTERTYVILLTRAGMFPRNIVARCGDDPTKASEFFMATQSDSVLPDIEPLRSSCCYINAIWA